MPAGAGSSARPGNLLTDAFVGKSKARRWIMLKALITPVILGLAVAMVIRLMTPRRAY